MRLIVAAVGRLKQGPERELAERYRERAEQIGRRLGWQSVEVIEIRESRTQETEKRMIEESIALATIIPDKAAVILLDERGDNFDSAGFTTQIQNLRQQGRPACVFIIGGADGLAETLRERAAFTLALGKATWPHQMVRIMLLEQIYRAGTILSGHPYHRA